jgi:polyhydroxybutyrate depolymerase
MMTNRLGIELSNKIAAIGPVVATMFGDEKKPSNPVAAIIFNGLLDEHVNYEGGSHGGRHNDAWDNSVPPLAVESQSVFWARANGGTAKSPTIDESSKVRHLHYDCPQGRNVEMYIVKDNAHAWPGGQKGGPNGDVPSQSINCTDVMWDFFKRQSR